MICLRICKQGGVYEMSGSIFSCFAKGVSFSFQQKVSRGHNVVAKKEEEENYKSLRRKKGECALLFKTCKPFYWLSMQSGVKA